MILIRALLIVGCLFATGTALSIPAMATPVVSSLMPSLAPPEPLGTSITFTAIATDTDPGTISYRFETGSANSSTLTMVRDYSVTNTFAFTEVNHPGNFQIVVYARNNSTGNIGSLTYSPFAIKSLVVNGQPAVTPLANPLTALFSSPPCASGGLYMRVSINRSGGTSPFYTSWNNCAAGETMNFIIAGMRASTAYNLQSQTWNGTSLMSGPVLTFTTGTIPVPLEKINTVTPFTSQDSSVERFLLLAFIFTNQYPMAIDLSGAPVWYYVDPAGYVPVLTRPVAGGQILMLSPGTNSAGTPVREGQILRKIDLAGDMLRETNATRVAEQLSALSGITSNCQIGGTDCLAGAFHHEALQLPNGHIVAITDEEKIFTDGTQGSSSTNPVDIIGDIIVDLDTNWQVAWYWRAFDHLDANRAAVLGETCTNGQEGCPPVLLTTGMAQDWLHGNALYYTPSDGSLLFSMRHQDWIDKIDYGSGSGTGNVIWTLGQDGDFAINSTDPYPWFSHQHDPGFVQNGTTTLAMFDNGNTRVSPPPLGLGYGHSRGYVLNVDQVNMVVTPTLLADLGYFSEALGSAELLANGDYHFEAGLAYRTPTYSEAIEVFPDATLGYTTEASGANCYRSFRLADLYTLPDKD